MPNINLTRVLLSTMLADRVAVQRRRQYIGEDGRVAVSQQVFPSVVGTVTMAGPDDLKRLPEYQVTGRVISFVSLFRCQSQAAVGGTQYQPDRIVWRGDTYIVAVMDPYPQFGGGFTQALAYSVDSTDQSPNFNPKAGAYQFNFQRNSGYAPLAAAA